MSIGMRPIAAVVVVLVLGASQSWAECVPRRYNTSGARVEGKINVHLIPHTHDDTGWLKTVDQYYFGSRQDIQLAGVQYVLDTVIYALLANPDRKFSYAEMSFFTRWWNEQTGEHQDAVKRLVNDSRLGFINGGWVQHDEAAAHYVAMIDQTTRGHRFLEETFGVRPKIGWQIDPFGHSNTHASLLSGFLGFDGLFFGRSDYQDLDRRKHTHELELLWRGSKSFGSCADIFLGTFPSGNYGPPAGFYFDWGNYDPPVQDNVCFVEYNVEERVDSFVKAAQDMAALYDDDDVFWPMGTDFTYSNAFTWFKNMDKLIHYVNLDGRVNAFYSSPEEYVRAKHALNVSWPLKTDDFFPYADQSSAMWTGYFTSRPTSKGYIRGATSYLQAARQLELHLNTSGHTDQLEEAVALLQHHDAITGTEKQHVANDYHKRLAGGLAVAERFVSKALSHLVYTTESAADSLSRAELGADSDADPLLLLHQCPNLNVSVCEISTKLSKRGEPFLAVAYNPLGWSRKSPIRIPVVSNRSTSWSVQDEEGNDVKAQLVPVSAATKRVQTALLDNGALPRLDQFTDHELVFIADVPPLSHATFLVTQSPRPSDGNAAPDVRDWTREAVWNSTEGREEAVVIGNGAVEATYCPRTGRMKTIRSRSGKAVDLDVRGAWYNSSDPNGPGDPGPASGAYIFRPNGFYRSDNAAATTSVHGPVVTEVHQSVLDFLSVTTRFWHGFDFAEVEWTAGPIPVADGLGKEVVIQYATNLSTGDVFYTDANGRELQKRKLDHRDTWKLNVTQPVAGNYYPITAAIAIKDAEEAELSVLVDRAQGATSLKSGEIEVMVHRRTLLDDSRGVAEPINETIATCRFCDSPGLIARGTHFLGVEEPLAAAAQRRRLQQLLNDPVVVAFGPAPPKSAAEKFPSPAARPRALGAAQLPPNVHLLTTKVLEDGKLLLRLAHLFAVDEDAGELAESAEVDLNSLFRHIQFDEVEELGLAGAQPLSTIKRLQWREGHRIGPSAREDEAATNSFERGPAPGCSSRCRGERLDVKLSPMEIRTFLLTPVRTDAAAQSAVETS